MPIKIIKRELKWARPLKPLNTTQIIGLALHHMEHLTWGISEIHDYHLNLGWKGFAYNWWIDFEGNIYECRGLNSGGGLYDPLNDTVLSIGFQGDYNITKEMPIKQYNAGVELVKYLKQLIPTIQTINGHKYWQSNTSCPGKYFPLKKMIERIDTKINDYDDVADWAKEAVLRMIETGIMVGDGKKYFNPNQPITRQEVAVVVSRLLDYMQTK